jgi:hypothetical protein
MADARLVVGTDTSPAAYVVRGSSRASPPPPALTAADGAVTEEESEYTAIKSRAPEREVGVRLQLEVEVGGKQVATQVWESDLNRYAMFAEEIEVTAVDWAVGKALERALGITRNVRGASRATFRLEPILHGRRISDNCDPDTWEGLISFVDKGGKYRANRGLRGGMDPSHANVLRATRLSADRKWTEIDRYYAVLQEGQQLDPADEGSDEGQLATALFAKTSIGQMSALAALPPAILARAMVTPARIMALQVVMERGPWDPLPTVPDWIGDKRFIEIRFNNVRARELAASEQGNSYRQVQTALFGALGRIAPALEPFSDWEILRPETKIDGDMRAKPELIGITAVVPTGSWVIDLLKGSSRLTTGSYCTLQPRDGFCEAMLDFHDSRLLLAIGMSTQQEAPVFLAMLNEAFREAMGTDLVQARITTSKAVGGGKGHQVKIVHFPITSDQAEIAVGIDAFTLLLRHRERPTIELKLGRRGETPVSIRIGCPQVPLRCLHGMLHSTATPLRLIAANAEFEANFICYGPLPKEWMAKAAPNAVARTVLRDHLRTIFRTHIGALETRFIGRYSGKLGGGPILLYLEFATPEASRLFIAAVRANALPAEMMQAIAPFTYAGAPPQYLCSSSAPAEALELLKEKELLALLTTAQAGDVAWPLPPPAHPPPDATQGQA